MANSERLLSASKLEIVLAKKFRKQTIIHYDDLIAAIADVPSVDAVEVVHGRYVHKGAWHIECSECKYILAHISEAQNYCPNCGAKMKGGNEDG